MSQTRVDSVRDADNEDIPQVPTEVIDAIENLAEGNTASKDEIESALNF